MVFVVSACVEQAESINKKLPRNSSPCCLVDVAPGLEKNPKDTMSVSRLRAGIQIDLLQSIDRNSLMKNVLDEVIWKAVTSFSSVVCSLKF